MMLLKTAACTLWALCSADALAAQVADTIARNAGRPAHAGVATLQRELTIGVAEGDDHYLLGSVADIAVSESGDIYVWDRIAPAIRVYNAAGKYVRTIGARGGGPGEYVAGAGLALARNGNLLLWDPGNARINVYRGTGEFVTSWPTRSGGVGSVDGHGLLTVDVTGTIYARKMFIVREEGKPIDTRIGWIRFRSNGSLQDTVFAPPYPAARLLHAEARGQFSSRVVPFMPNLDFELSPLGYFVSGVSDRIALNIHEPGKPVVSIRRTLTPQRVTANERDSARAEITKEMRKIVPSWSWNGPEIPRTKPVYSSLTIASDGRLWVQLAEGPPAKEDSTALGRGQMMVTERRAEGPVRTSSWSCPSSGWLLFDVYEPSGTYLGQVRVPERVDPIVLRGDLIWAATCDTDGVPSVGRYRIVWR